MKPSTARIIPVDSRLDDSTSVQNVGPEALSGAGGNVVPKDRAKFRRMASQRLRGALVVVDLEPWPAFGIAWILLFIAHSICIAFLLATTATLKVLASVNMDFYSDLLRADLQQVLNAGRVFLTLLICLHALQLVLMLVATWRQGRFQLTSFTAESSRILNRRQQQGHRQSFAVTHIRRFWRTFFGRQGLLGIESPYYEWRYALAELTEVMSLSLQAYSSSSHLDPNRWLIASYVACAVFNCWSTPIVMHVTTKWYSPAARRLACVVLNTVFESGTAMVLPFVILLPFIRAFDAKRYSFDTYLLYNDVWYTNLINESRQIFPLSTFDLLVKIVPHTGIFMALKTVRSIIRSKQTTPPNNTSSSKHFSPRNVNDGNTVAKSANMPAQPTKRREVKRGKFVDRFFFVWALALLACHISSSAISVGSTHDPQCKQPLRPWFVREQACSLYMFNCYHRATDSVQDGDLAFLHRPSLAVLVFAHCPALRMTSSIRSFPKLLGVEVYNSTLVEWGAHAAISAETHPVLSYIFIVRTNMSEIPLGIRGSDLPSTLMDIEFSVTNLTGVPDDLDVVWSQLSSLYIENSRLTSVPDVLQRMPLSELSLIGNEIANMSSIMMMAGDDYMVSLARNPVRDLPSEWETMSETGVVLNFVETDIARVPDWFRDMVQRLSMVVTLYGTPFCRGLAAEEAMQFYGPSAPISCSLTSERLRGRYPLFVTTPLWHI